MSDRHSSEPFCRLGAACGLLEPHAASLAQSWRGCFQFKCELNEEKNVSLGNSIGARSSDRCWSLLSHRASVLSSRIANYFRGRATAEEGREVAGAALGGICQQTGTGMLGPAHHLPTPLPGPADICGQGLPCPLVSALWSTWRRQQGLFLPELLWPHSKGFVRSLWEPWIACGSWVVSGKRLQRGRCSSHCVKPKLLIVRTAPGRGP